MCARVVQTIPEYAKADRNPWINAVEALVEHREAQEVHRPTRPGTTRREGSTGGYRGKRELLRVGTPLSIS